MGEHRRLAATLGGPDLAWLRDRVRRRLAAGRAVTGVLALHDPSEAQIAAASRLLGRRYRPVATLRIAVAEADRALAQAGVAASLAEAVIALDGPVEDERARRERLAAAWSAVEAQVAAIGPPSFADRVQASGLLKRLAGGDPSVGAVLVADLAAVLAALPARQVTRSRFAADVLRDAHALDDGRPLATLVRSAIRERVGPPALPGAEGRVETWAAVGVLVGDLTSTVLVAGFGGGPQVWTLRQVARGEVDLSAAAGRPVFAAENPAVLAEAVDALGTACPPLVCGSGKPTVAVVALLRALAPIAAGVRYHGDFDADGVGIANRLIARVGVRPWRFGTADYESAVQRGVGGRRLRAAPPAASWDAGLAPAMTAHGVVVEEEAVLDDLLADLAAPVA
jgi:uncharacterized protein (TIGR02679 family)